MASAQQTVRSRNHHHYHRRFAGGPRSSVSNTGTFTVFSSTRWPGVFTLTGLNPARAQIQQKMLDPLYYYLQNTSRKLLEKMSEDSQKTPRKKSVNIANRRLFFCFSFSRRLHKNFGFKWRLMIRKIWCEVASFVYRLYAFKCVMCLKIDIFGWLIRSWNCFWKDSSQRLFVDSEMFMFYARIRFGNSLLFNCVTKRGFP